MIAQLPENLKRQALLLMSNDRFKEAKALHDAYMNNQLLGSAAGVEVALS